MLSRRRLLNLAAAQGAAPFFAAALGAQLAWPATAQAQAVPSWSEDARRRLMPGNGDERERALALRLRLLDEGEAHLAAGRGGPALETFERAAGMLHAPDTELGIVRAHMALGSYRRALAFCAHAAGAHREQPGGAALYAWLLHIGGQEAFARRVLEQALAATPSSLLAEAAERLRMAWPAATQDLLRTPWRTAPYASGALPAAGSRAAGSAALAGSGEAALVPTPSLGQARAVWLRNGLGQTVRGGHVLALVAPGLTVLSLEQALPAPAWQTANREPFAGSPGSMVEYAPDAAATAAWPLMRQGFFQGAPASSGAGAARPLGLGAPAGARGGPVFDRSGRLAGVALQSAEGGDRLLSLSALPPDLLPAAAPAGSERSAGDVAPAPAGLGTALDAVYEQALLGALQVIVLA